MSNNRKTESGGITFPGLLLVAFIVLKLTGVISWSWWWVMAPLWILAAIMLLFVIVGVIIDVARAIRKKNIRKKMNKHHERT